MPPAPLPAEVLARMVRSDPGRPRLTCYDDRTGERVELSARTLANWVAKAANLLQEDADGEPGSLVGLDMPAHWRTLYWALAVWSVGATAVVGPAARDAQIVVTTSAEVAAAAVRQSRYAVLVTLAALTRANPDTPPGVVDEAKDLPAQADSFAAWAMPDSSAAALLSTPAAPDAAYRHVVGARAWPASPRVLLAGGLAQMLRDALAAWRMDGSVVLVVAGQGDQSARLAAERVTVDLRP